MVDTDVPARPGPQGRVTSRHLFAPSSEAGFLLGVAKFHANDMVAALEDGRGSGIAMWRTPSTLAAVNAAVGAQSETTAAQWYTRACSRLEDTFWEKQLDDAIQELITDQNEEGLNAALDHLHGSNSRAYDMLADMIEAHCETRRSGNHDIQLICMPILAWSRYNIPSCTIPAPTLEAVKTQLQAHVLAADAKLSLANFIFSPDQLPQGFCPGSAFGRLNRPPCSTPRRPWARPPAVCCGLAAWN